MLAAGLLGALLTALQATPGHASASGNARIDAQDIIPGGGAAQGTQRKLVGGVESGVTSLTQSPRWRVRAGVVPPVLQSMLPPPMTLTLDKGPRMFGAVASGIYPLTAGIVEGTSYLVRWNPARSASATTYKYEYLTAFETSSPSFSGALERGRGYWRMGNDLVNYAVRPPGDCEVAVALPLGTAAYQGWNMLANPFLSTVLLADQQVRPAGSPASANTGLSSAGGQVLVSDSVWGYPLVDASRPNASGYQLYSLTFPDALQAIPAGSGVWVRALQDATWVWRCQSSGGNPSPARSAAAGGWLVRLTAQSGDLVDLYNYFGVGDSSRQLHNPPPPADEHFLDLRFEGGSRAAPGESYAASIQPLGRGGAGTWQFLVESTVEGEQVELAWPNLSTVPKEVRLILVDLETGKQTYMRTASGYNYRNNSRAPRRFEIQTDNTGAAALRLTGIRATPGRGGTLTLSYVLSQPASVRLRIANAAGRTVGESVTTRSARAGINNVAWTARQAGRPLPAGVYMIEVLARAEDGRVARGLATVRLGR